MDAATGAGRSHRGTSHFGGRTKSETPNVGASGVGQWPESFTAPAGAPDLQLLFSLGKANATEKRPFQWCIEADERRS